MEEQNIEELLTPEEVDFVKLVWSNPSAKLHNCFHLKVTDDDQCESIPLWENPERLGIIRCVGGYKWEPVGLTMKLFTTKAN